MIKFAAANRSLWVRLKSLSQHYMRVAVIV
jgi:hypothetical protein